jgi:hypothetical protein
MDTWAVAAARNNADWCDLVCRCHGIATSVDRDVWVAHRRSPPFYPDAVTLAPLATVDAILDRVDGGIGCSVKDSFDSVDLTSFGFRTMFEAEWIHRSPAPAIVDSVSWKPARPDDLRAVWGRVLLPSLLADPAVAMLVARAGDEIVAGVIANRSRDVVGLTNLVVLAADQDEIWTGAIAAISARFPDLPIVGYESGDDLAAAHRAGFVSIGPLRVWLM